MITDPPAAPWSLYDALIAGIPDGITVTGVLANHWSVITTDAGGVGLAMVYEGGPRAGVAAFEVRGQELRQVAALAKSWDLKLASIGVAAMNAWYATPERLATMPGVMLGREANYFFRRGATLGDRRTAIVGHFPDVEELPGDITILERRPRGNDLPDAACEYVLPTCERVAITGSSLVNKTLPRLLELARNAEVHLVGPTAPPALGTYPPCVREIAGSTVVDPEQAVFYAGLGVRQLIDSPALQMFTFPLDPRPETGDQEGDNRS